MFQMLIRKISDSLSLQYCPPLPLLPDPHKMVRISQMTSANFTGFLTTSPLVSTKSTQHPLLWSEFRQPPPSLSADVIYVLPLSNSLVPLSEVPAELPGYNKGGDIKGGIPDTTFIPPSIPPLYIPKRAAMARVKCIMSMTEYRYRSSLLRNSPAVATLKPRPLRSWIHSIN